MTPEQYIGGLDDRRMADIGRLHERIRQQAPRMQAYVDEIVRTSADNDGRKIVS